MIKAWVSSRVLLYPLDPCHTCIHFPPVIQVPEAELPTYQKGGHMRGPDIVNYEQVRAEIVSALHLYIPRSSAQDYNTHIRP